MRSAPAGLFRRGLLPWGLVPLFVISLPAAAQELARGESDELEVAAFEDYREAAGRLEDGALRVRLEARAAAWRPWGPDGPTVRAHVFAEEGRESQVPGPLLRAAAGNPIHLSLRNTLSDTLMVRGLRDRGQELPPGVPVGPAIVPLAFVGDSVLVAPGEIVDVRFTPTVPGDYFYFGKTMEPGWSARPQPLFGAASADRALSGVMIVDAAEEAPHPDERIFLITQWADRQVPESWLPSARFLINGRAWPHTERLVYAQGDTVRWRVINESGSNHPMHLHGFYFHVDVWTAQTGQSLFQGPPRPAAVTWALPPTTAARLSWVAHEPGNWIFHCHLMRHMSWIQHPGSWGDAALASPDDDGHREARSGNEIGMGGLVLGITVRPGPYHRARTDVVRRRLDLHIGRREGVFGEEAGYGFVLQEGPEPPPADSVRFPGSPLILTRGEPTEIVVHNRADVPLGVHWHGLELESWADGVPGWSGTPEGPVPAIASGDSLAVRMTPPRAGTFMYHVHSEPGHQLAQGLYGPFLVLDPDQPWDPETDRFFLLAALGAGEDPPPAVNGRWDPEPLELRAGTTYRLRFMSISPNENKSVRLLEGETPVEWLFVARDGADLPRPIPRPANLPFVDVGTTLDFLWTPEEPGERTLRVVTTFDQGLAAFPREAPPPHAVDIPIRVR